MTASDAPSPTPTNAAFSAPLLQRHRQPFTIADDFPDTSAVLGAIPKRCFEKSYAKSFGYLAVSLILAAAAATAAHLLLPTPAPLKDTTALSVLLWAVYAFWQGAILTGLWVVAHECGHNAFCDNKTLQDAVGFVLHSALLVPYFSWQRSHAVHHSRTNHMAEGETHVPNKAADPAGAANFALSRWIGEDGFAIVNLFNHLVLGWPLYLLVGATGGPVRGTTCHFVPSDSLFPGDWRAKVWLSDVGVLAAIAGLIYASKSFGGPAVAALYVGPYLFVNMWLVLYTWLQHTDVDIPHYEADQWTWLKGAFCTVDRPYPEVFDFLHHRIGSTHVAHHLCSRIPHYNAQEATDAIKKAFPEHYKYDPTPVHEVMYRCAKKCLAVVPEGKRWYYTDKPVEVTPTKQE
mmetsp:Transcript_14290/g.38241  ORF Transcript_14290/g.38241 Transcript_14290/m.38241 type:complete len:403 (-) Transcript_14290:154-1362(-)|eukprot:CAMPEP_0174909014 /NCGR_PEP_ID=MMETSP0167-20121228/66735_1 /TAXON_ID=38298 /ORGANISM="Rhodella maculata, Strain CCMP736" /LENGTH=402 /DNA_ID=CAMNT_0016152881 /DNA_START=44 /DNA_END=1252 /DNA_ORIENTATION=-